MASGSVRLVFIALIGLPAFAQPGAKALEFEIASVKPADPTIRTSNVLLGAGESMTIVNVPLRKIITYAYDIRGFQLGDGPGWISDERYDIVAKSARSDGTSLDPRDETDAQRRDRVARVRERLRSLRWDRFGLRVHFDQREHPVLRLGIAKGGSKLAAVKTDNPQGRISTVDGRIQGYGAPVSMLVTQLSIATGLIVDDETGLRERYDFVLDWAPDEKDQRDTRPSIFTAVIEQLGLRLEPAKGLVKSVVIDHVERPSAN